ncbi:tRNA-dependent cyclodipeptide synthase [Kitasatospora sp. NPDC088346]|uniref:tRNA-dependent cyclodipeptide synthase n=1 Tax=Kitasatospora sp. NPDC088346 TaxID=3364073 RepID=UPI003811B965
MDPALRRGGRGYERNPSDPNPSDPTLLTETLPAAPPDTFEAVPYSARCRTVFDRGDHLLIGVSPGSGYFSHQRLADLIRWGRAFFERIDVVHADLHVAAQFRAGGHPADQAERRAAKEVKATARRIRRAVEETGPDRVRTHALSDFTPQPAYRRLHTAVLAALDADPVLRAATEGMARGFLHGTLAEGGGPTPAQLAAGVDYIAAELPFFLDTPALLGVTSSVACYHVELPLTAVLFGPGQGLRAVPDQGYAVVRPAAVPQPVAA